MRNNRQGREIPISIQITWSEKRWSDQNTFFFNESWNKFNIEERNLFSKFIEILLLEGRIGVRGIPEKENVLSQRRPDLLIPLSSRIKRKGLRNVRYAIISPTIDDIVLRPKAQIAGNGTAI